MTLRSVCPGSKAAASFWVESAERQELFAQSRDTSRFRTRRSSSSSIAKLAREMTAPDQESHSACTPAMVKTTPKTSGIMPRNMSTFATTIAIRVRPKFAMGSIRGSAADHCNGPTPDASDLAASPGWKADLGGWVDIVVPPDLAEACAGLRLRQAV